MDTVRILHVSDLHVSSRLQTSESFLKYHLQKRSLVERFSRPASEVRMKTLLRAARQHAPDCDAILITGDLANSGDREDLEAARLFCGGRYIPKATRDRGLGSLDPG
jgi:3',5'-cyclic AMP phosphodiesterase CpdA